MGKDKRHKTKGSWWYGWVKYTYYDPFSKTEKEVYRATDWEFDTIGQAKRAADALAGALAAPHPVGNWERKYRSKTKKMPSRLKVVETGASRVE